MNWINSLKENLDKKEEVKDIKSDEFSPFSISLNGVDQYITVPNGQFATGDYTISMWVNLDKDENWHHYVVNKTDEGVVLYVDGCEVSCSKNIVNGLSINMQTVLKTENYSIARLMVFNRILSNIERKELHDCSSGIFARKINKNLTHCFDFEPVNDQFLKTI